MVGVVKLIRCENTEQLGILVERALCEMVNVSFNTKRKYNNTLDKDVYDDIYNTIGGVLRGMNMRHVGNLNRYYDFELLDSSIEKISTMSVKTLMSGNKICPQNIGQCALSKLSDRLLVDFKKVDVFKGYFLDNKKKMLDEYLVNLFCCEKMMVFRFDKGKIYIINGGGKGDMRLSGEFSLSTSRDLNSWNESNTVYLEERLISKRYSLGELQIHNNRNCVKFRFNMDTLLYLIDCGYINLKYDVYDLCGKYKFKVNTKDKGKDKGKDKVEMSKSVRFPSFNYIGSKLKLLDFIRESIMSYTGKESYKDVLSFADVCSGTGVVSFDVMSGGCDNIMTNDIQRYAYVVSSVWCDRDIDIEKMKGIITRLNNKISVILDLVDVDIEKYFVYKNYTEAGVDGRLYLTKLNGYKTDLLRINIEELYKGGEINNNEYNLLLKLLLYAVTGVSNVASVYGAYLKKYKAISLRDIILNIDLLSSLVKVNKRDIKHVSYNKSISELLKDDDLSSYEIVYIDPPYVANRSYHDNYHLLETISRYDNPKIKGKTGLRELIDTKSKFCSKREAYDEFKLVLGKIRSKYLFLSYSSESIVCKDDMIDLMKDVGWLDVRCYEKDYHRFKSNKNNDDKRSKMLKEYIFCGRSNLI